MPQKNAVYEALETRPKTLDDIMHDNVKSTQGLLTIKAGTTVYPGELLVTKDGGVTFTQAYKDEYDSTKEDYELDFEVVYEMYIYKALVTNPPANSISDDTKWEKKEKLVVNGSLICTFPMTATTEDKIIHAGVSINCKLVEQGLTNVNQSIKLAGFPNICIY